MGPGAVGVLLSPSYHPVGWREGLEAPGAADAPCHAWTFLVQPVLGRRLSGIFLNPPPLPGRGEIQRCRRLPVPTASIPGAGAVLGFPCRPF